MTLAGNVGEEVSAVSTLRERFEAKVSIEPNTGCWLWAASVNRHGYGCIKEKGSVLRAHRVSWLLHVGPVPEGLELDHLCRVRCCVNPSHLRAVTSRENTLAGEGLTARQARQTHCKRGHSLEGPNLRIEAGGRRRCMACEKLRNACKAARIWCPLCKRHHRKAEGGPCE